MGKSFVQKVICELDKKNQINIAKFDIAKQTLVYASYVYKIILLADIVGKRIQM